MGVTPLVRELPSAPATLLHKGLWRYPDGADFLHLWRCGTQVRADCARLGCFVFSGDGRQVAYRCDPSAASADCDAYFWSTLVGLALELQGTLCLHGSAVVDPSGLVLVFVGASGAGKSTIAAHAVGAGWGLAADDMTPIADGPHGPTALALPQWLRLAPATAHGLGVTAARRRGYDTAAHKELFEAHRWSPLAAPPRVAVFVLERVVAGAGPAMGAAPVLSRLTGVAAWTALARHSLLAPLLRPLGREGSHFDRLADLAARVPVWRLRYADGLDHLPGAVAAARKAAEAAGA